MVRLVVAVVALVSVMGPRSMAAQDDKTAVIGAVKSFLGALKTRDTMVMKAQLDSTSRFTLVRPGPSGSRVIVLRGADFIRTVSRSDQPPFEEPIRNPVVQIDGDIASVWAEYQVLREGQVSHCGFDAFHLARLDGKWKIVNLIDSFRPTGCGGAWTN